MKQNWRLWLILVLVSLTLFSCGVLPPCGGYECTSGIACEGRCP
jgi:hypothetical protein